MARNFQLTARALGALLLGLPSAALLTAGCRQSPAPQPPKTEMVHADLSTVAREAMDRRDYTAAVAALREVLAHRPADLDAHYRLAVSASHLDQVDEAAREFEWVVTHGKPPAAEVEIARQWLTLRAVPTVIAPDATASQTELPASKPGLATLMGRAVGREGVATRLQLFLKGLPGTPVQDEYHVLRTDQRGNYRFHDVAPGDYMLTNVIAGRPAWRLRVSLRGGESLTLDLSPANQASVRDDFPSVGIESRPR